MKRILIFFTLLAIGNTESEKYYYCTTFPENNFIAESLKSSQSSTEPELIRLEDCNAALLIKPLDQETEKLLSKCIQSGVLKVNIVPFIVVGNYELPEDKFPALFANERRHNSKEPYDFLVHWFTGTDDDALDYDYEDRGIERAATPLQIAVNVMRRGFKQAQKLAGQIIKFGRPGSVGPAAAGFVAGTLLG